MADKTSIMKDAQKFLAKGQIDKAIGEWEKLISESPDGNTFNIIGDLYLKKGDKKSAVESFHRAASYFRQEGFSLKALALYKKVLNISPHDSDALHTLGELSEEKGLITDAIKYYLASADILSKEGKKDRILPIYEKILSLSPANIPLRNRVAEIFLKEGLISDACKEYAFIAGIYNEKGETDRTREYYQKILSIQPSNRDALTGLSSLCQSTGDMAGAMDFALRAAELFPDDLELLCRCGGLSLAAGDSETAKEYLQKVIERDPEHRQSRRLLGDILLGEGAKERAWTILLPLIDQALMEEDYEAAITMLENFRDIEPLETSRRMVSLFRQTGRTDAVVSELSTLGDALRDRGMDDDALGCYREALELRPDSEELKEKIAELTPAPEPEEEEIIEAISAEKPAQDAFMEADIFLRYGLLTEAAKLLESMKLQDPQNIDVHIRLKSLYAQMQDRELAVTECLILHELYKRSGKTGEAEAALTEAFSIYPEDPRLAERGRAQPAEKELKPEGLVYAGGASIEDYAEELAEAEFYSRQGLVQEASEILERLQKIFPGNEDIAQRLRGLSLEATVSGPQEFEEAGLHVGGEEHGSTELEVPAERPESEGPQEEEFEDLLLSNQDFVEAQEIPEPVLDDDVMDIFQEFKRGLEKELGEDDSETHYNLGIAYKEMGLIDDAIKEFQTARGDAVRFIQASTMLGICYTEKGLYSLAVETLSAVASTLTEEDEAFWPVKYDLAEARERNGELNEALGLYTEVFGWNAGYRSVSEKVGELKSRLGVSAGRNEKPSGEEKPKKKDRVSYL